MTSPNFFRSALVSAAGAAVLAGCASTPQVSVQSEEQAIRDLSRQWVQAVQAKDFARIAGMYTADAHFMAPNTPVASGTQAIRGTWEGLLGLPNVSLTFAPSNVTVAASGDLASEIGTYQLAFDGPQGRVEDDGRYVVTWRKANGEWKAVSDIVTSSKPLPEPPAAAAASPPAHTGSAQPQMNRASALQWTDVKAPGFAPGLRMAVVSGDPSTSGMYTVRLRFPANYEFPPHWHPQAEHLTVLQGTFRLAMGERMDRSALQTYGVGDFLYMPARMPHYGGVQGETVIQLHGVGPFEINLVSATP